MHKIACSIIFLIITVQLWLCCDSNIVMNYTESMPVGIWYKTDKPCCNIDDVVLINTKLLSERRGKEFNQGIEYGYFDANTSLMKRIKGLEGDIVDLTSDGIYINGKLIPDTKPRTQDGLGRVITSSVLHNRTLQQNEIIVAGENIKSFDSRYFGIIHKDEILTAVVPLITF